MQKQNNLKQLKVFHIVKSYKNEQPTQLIMF